jgi:hypothetical protein
MAIGSNRGAIGIGALNPGSRRIELELDPQTAIINFPIPMDLIKVPKVVYHEAGATSLIYNAKNDILFVVLSDQTGVVVVCENLPTGQQMSRLEYKYNSPTDFINGIQIYGTYPFKVMRHSLQV